MNGPEHYREAERLLKRAEDHSREGGAYLLRAEDRARFVAAAQVHATLALVAATVADRDHIAPRVTDDDTATVIGGPDAPAWLEVTK